MTPDKNIERLRAAFSREMARRPFEIEAIVILPDHLHALWQLPEGDCDYSKRWGSIKKYFSIGCRCAEKDNTRSRRDKRESNIWQRRFWEHTICDQRDWNNHLDYIHYNPVKHGLVAAPGEWKYSSFRKWVEKGVYTKDWGQIAIQSLKDFDWE